MRSPAGEWVRIGAQARAPMRWAGAALSATLIALGACHGPAGAPDAVPDATSNISGDWVTWQDDRDGNWDIYAYQISTGQEIPLVTEPHDQIAPYLCDDLVVWGDYRWSSNTLDGWQKDLVVYDLSTGFWRRVTGWTDTWIPAAPQAGWLVYRRATGQFEAEVYAMDLVANLILSPSGRVIP